MGYQVTNPNFEGSLSFVCSGFWASLQPKDKHEGDKHYAELIPNPEMEMRKPEIRELLRDKRVWFASFLVAWAAALQGHMMWMQRQDSFKQKFGDHKSEERSEEAAENQ